MRKPRDRNDQVAQKAKFRRQSSNKQIATQTRKLLGKHYANKYGKARG